MHSGVNDQIDADMESLRTKENSTKEISVETKTLMAFTRKTMPSYRPHWHHDALAEMLDRVATAIAAG